MPLGEGPLGDGPLGDVDIPSAPSFDDIRFYGSGAAVLEDDQPDPDANLGGFKSSNELFSLGLLGGLKSIRFNRVGEGNSPGGLGSLESDGDSYLRWTEPGAAEPGAWTQVLDGTEVFLPGVEAAKGLRVTRDGVFPNAGARSIRLLDLYNGALGLDNVSHAERAAGESEYRAIFIKNGSSQSIDFKLWLGSLGTMRTLDTGYSASGAVTLAPDTGNFKDWPKTGYVYNKNAGEVLYYASRTDAQLNVASGGRDVFGDVAGGAAGNAGDELYPVSGLRIALETPVSGEVQTIADEDTAPTGLSWAHPVGASDALTQTVASGELLGLWIERAIPAGATAAARIENQIVVQGTTAGLDVFEYTLRGCYRMEDTGIEKYELYRGVDAAPDFEAAPWETFSSLPHLSAALTPGHTYQFVTRFRNRYNLLSQNFEPVEIQVDGSGVEATPPSAPSFQTLEPAADGAGRVKAYYDYMQDTEAIRGTHWAVWFTDDGSTPDPDIDTPAYTEELKFVDGLAKLDWTSDPSADGSTLKAIVRVRRLELPLSPVDSQNTDIMTITSDAVGPDAPEGTGAFLGESAEQHQ